MKNAAVLWTGGKESYLSYQEIVKSNLVNITKVPKNDFNCKANYYSPSLPKSNCKVKRNVLSSGLV